MSFSPDDVRRTAGGEIVNLAGPAAICLNDPARTKALLQARMTIRQTTGKPVEVIALPTTLLQHLQAGASGPAVQACQICGSQPQILACLADDATIARARQLAAAGGAGAPSPPPQATAANDAASNQKSPSQPNCTYELTGRVVCRTQSEMQQIAVGKCKGMIPQRTDEGTREWCRGIFAENGTFAQQSEAEALQHFTRAAQLGNAEAEATLGLDYEQGRGGVKRDPAAAAGWYEKAARQGHTGAELNLGLLYEKGEGVPRDEPRARSLIAAAAAAGLASAQRKLDEMNGGAGKHEAAQPAQDLWEQGKQRYLAGDHAGAAQTIMKAAQAGNPEAEEEIGYIYENGDGMPKNLSEAVRWFKAAADQGNGVAENALGHLYEDGEGVPDDWDQAARWYRQSAIAGVPGGMLNYGRAFEFGIGVPQNRATAIDWLEKAAERGNAQAAYFAKELSNPMNNAGAANQAEQDYFSSTGRIHWLLAQPDPAGTTFHNSRERWAYWVQMVAHQSCQEARVMWQILASDYEKCRTGGGTNCLGPGRKPC